MARQPPVIVKLGGSLMATGRIGQIVNIVAGAPRPVIVVPGGGEFADAVRAVQMRLKFPDQTAHRMAIYAMHQTGLLLASQNPRLTAVETQAAMRCALQNAQIPVWLPLRMADRDAAIPADWSITSDGLAARLGELMHASAVMLVKSRRVSRDATAVALAQADVVDPTFAKIVERSRLKWRIFGPGEEKALAAALNEFGSGATEDVASIR
jgi:5-(aminomethyl)-3-furanmethanol phosphate kinase